MSPSKVVSSTCVQRKMEQNVISSFGQMKVTATVEEGERGERHNHCFSVIVLYVTIMTLLFIDFQWLLVFLLNIFNTDYCIYILSRLFLRLVIYYFL